MKKNLLISLGVIIGLAVLGLIFYRFVFLQSFTYTGDSMGEQFEAGDKVTINRTNRDFERGMIVVANDREGKATVRRIVGLPKEELEILHGEILVNGQKLSEDYAQGSFPKEEAYGFALKEDEYLLIADDRDKVDGRTLFPTKESDILGIYSPQATGFFSTFFGR